MPSAIAEDSVLGRINSLLDEYTATKTASELGTSGSAAEDPGGYRGKSSHPSARVDSGCGPATLGSRAKENERDAKETYPAAVDGTSPGAGGSQDDRQYNIGTRQSAVGEDPQTEDNYKADKDDPGTSSPANADDVGDKYASVTTEQLIKLSFHKMNHVLASLAEGQTAQPGEHKQAATSPPTPQEAARAGYNLSDSLLGSEQLDKLAAARTVIEQTIREAEADATRVGQYLNTRFAAWQKQADEAGAAPPMMPPDAGGGMPPGGPPGAMPPMGGMPPEAGMPPMGPGPGPGAEPGPAGPGAEPGPGPAPEEGGGAGHPGGPEHEAALEELANALLEMGYSPEELLEAAQAVAGGKQAAARVQQSERARKLVESMTKRADDARLIGQLSGQVIDLRDRGKIRLKKADGPARAERDEIKAYIREVCST